MPPASRACCLSAASVICMRWEISSARTSRHQYRRPLQVPLAQIRQRPIGIGERIARDLGLDAGLRREAKKFARVRAREIGYGKDLSFLPKNVVGKRRDVRHMNAATDHAAALLHRP